MGGSSELGNGHCELGFVNFCTGKIGYIDKLTQRNLRAFLMLED